MDYALYRKDERLEAIRSLTPDIPIIGQKLNVILDQPDLSSKIKRNDKLILRNEITGESWEAKVLHIPSHTLLVEDGSPEESWEWELDITASIKVPEFVSAKTKLSD